MKIRGPDYKVKIATPIGDGKYKYFHVGSAWMNEGNRLNFTLCFMPDVRFRLFPVDEKEEA